MKKFNYRKLVQDPAHITMDDMALIYSEVREIYKHVPPELLFRGEEWYKDCIGQIEIARDMYKDTYGKEGREWRIAFSECMPNMFGSQPSISSKKLDCFKKTLSDPNINFVVFPTPAGMHPDFKRNNEVTYDAHTRCRALDELGMFKMPTFLFIVSDHYPHGDIIAASYSDRSMSPGDVKPRRVRDIPLGYWDNNGIIIDGRTDSDGLSDIGL